MNIVLPVHISLMDWADSLKSTYPTLPRLEREEEWREWTDQVISFGVFREKNPPRHDVFLTWRDWAYEFTKAVN